MLGDVLLALDDSRLRARLRRTLGQADVRVESVDNQAQLWERLSKRASDLLIVSRSLLRGPALDAVTAIRAVPDAPDVVVLVGRRDAEDRARLIAAGCYAVLDADLSSAALRDVLSAILARRRSEATDRLVARRTLPDPRLSDFITTSPAMTAFMEVVHRLVASDTSLLVLGETGVGKEHLARAIHAESPRASGPFVAVNCGALTETLLESELFGHEEGAFTGAVRARRGAFELAHKGVVFLDEIGELPSHLQVKLLHVLQRREIQRLGAEATTAIDVRVMAATNRDVLAEVAAKSFRPDLYYRLSVVTLSIPPLRERREDIAVLVDSYLDEFRHHIRRDVTKASAEALAALERYDWPGNVRELVNVIERSMLLARGNEIVLEDLPDAIRRLASNATVPGNVAPAPAPADVENVLPAHILKQPLREARAAMLHEFEHTYLVALLRETNGRIDETARRAGMDPRSLFDKLKRHGLKKEQFRPARAE